ncbi:MAG: RNA polymerase sigma factor [Vicinamibacterales bacterium]
MDQADEREIIRRCREGDESAFASLVDAYKDLVFALSIRLTGNRDLAEDLAQDVFLRVHRGLPYFRGEARLGTWIYRIVANLATEPRFRRRPETSLDAKEEGRPSREVVSHDASFAELELKDRLEKAIARLPEHYQLLVAGHYLKGARYEDLAEAAGVPLGTVKTHLHRAKRMLRRFLDDPS